MVGEWKAATFLQQAPEAQEWCHPGSKHQGKKAGSMGEGPHGSFSFVTAPNFLLKKKFLAQRSCNRIAKVGGYGRFDLKIGIGMIF